MSDKHLFQSGTLNRLVLKNRIMVAPMTRISASVDGVPGERMRHYYQRFVRGGFGAIITEGMYIDEAWSQTYAFQAGLVNARQSAGWRAITDQVHQRGGKIIAQLMHAGAISQGNIYRSNTLAPSALAPRGEQLSFYHGHGAYPLPDAIDEAQIQQVIDSFAQAAARAIGEAGFDGIEIHAANGYLLDQFFTDYTNQRSDRWGGNIAQRLSLTLAVIAAVRQRVGNDATLGVRISQGKVNDFHHKWREGEAGARQVFALLAEAGVDYLHLTEYDALQPAFADSAYSLVQLARQAAPNLTIVANGSLGDASRAAQALEQGADYVSIGKSALANPDWPMRIRDGAELREFDKNLLAPSADVKNCELV
ncbi:NADH:flavin oxidoreductase [Pantoea sp. USHLN256]|uniref:NADH:flavin oxidoreductase n=1 Tax=Pantoea sp. USHLN256 TaxID=3081293 RepID=UPI00301A24C7